MEKRQREETLEGSRSHQSTLLTGTLTLKNFTIPRKKRTSGEVLLECCSEESRDYNLIQTKLRDAKLDTRKDRANAWVWKDIRLVHNEELLKMFSEKRAEMRTKGRHGREMEERFCFLVASDQMAAQIYQHGLRVGSTVQYALGKPSHGVYLFRHVDVALNSYTSVLSAKKILIFKVLYGKVKKIAPSLDWNKTQDPTVAFDCHMCKDAVSYRDTLHQQVLGSSVFLFDFNEKQELTERPRQCLPYAVVSFVPSSNVILTVPTNLPPSASALPIGQVHDHFKACTVAERRGKGDSATVTFKHFGMPGCFEMDCTPQNPGVEAPPQKTDMQNTQSFNPKQHWIAASEDADSSSSGLAMDHTALCQSLLGKKACLSNYKKNTGSTHGRNDNTWDTVPPSPLDKISTIVYSSRLVRDPRLSRHEANQQTSCSEPRVTYTGSGCDRKCQPPDKNQEDNYGFAGNTFDSKEPSYTDKKDTQRESSRTDQCAHTTTLPSMKLFKMKFQKYAAYFRMSQEERHHKIWSQENMSPEQKQELADRIHFYEVYYQKYKEGLIFQNVNETKKTSRLSQREPKENHMLQTKDNTYKHNQSSVCQQKSHDAASLSDNNDIVNRDKCSTTHIHKTSHPYHPEFCAVMLTEKGQGQAPETHQDHPDRCLIQSPDKLSVESLVLRSLNLNLTYEKTDTQNVQLDLKQPSPLTCRSNEAKLNHSLECESELAVQDLQENESTPGINLFEKPSTESCLTYTNNIMDNMDNTVMEIASCVEVSSCGTSDNCDLSLPMAVKQKQNGKSCFEDSERSPELDMERVKQDNSTHWELYKRIQLDQLLPCMFQKHVFSSSTNRDMGRPSDNISKLKNESKDHSKAETNLNMGFWEDIHLKVTLKASKTSAHTTEVLSLSERFSKIKVLQTKLSERNNEMIQSPMIQMCSSKGYKETATSNVELIQLLAQRYSKSKMYVKRKSLRRPGSKKACLKKLHTVLSLGHSLKRSKYVKKTHFWKAKKNLSRTTVSAERPHETVNSKATSDSSNSQSEIVLTEDEDQDLDSHTSDDRQSSHVQGSQEANATLPEDKPIEEPVKPTEPLSEDICKSDSVYTEKATKDFTPNLIPVMVAKGKQVKTAENISNQSQTSLITCTSKEHGSNTECKEENMLLNLTSETGLNPLSKEHFTMKSTVDDDVDGLSIHDCEASETHSDVPASNTIISNKTELHTNMTPEAKVMDAINATAETDTKKCSEQNAIMKNTLNVQCFEGTEYMSVNIPHMNQSCLKMFTSTSNVSSVWSTDSEAFENTTSASKPCGPKALKYASNNVVDLTVDDPALSVQCKISSEHTKKSSKTCSLGSTKSPSTLAIKDNCNLSKPDQNKMNEANTPETQLISKLRNYLSKFESTVKKQEAENEDLKERPVVWITLDSTAHKQQLFEKSQYCMVNVPCLMPDGGEAVKKDNSGEYTEAPVQARKVLQSEHAQNGTDVCLLVPVESKRGRRSSQTKRTSNQKSRRSSVTSVSPDSTSAIDTVKGNSPHPFPQVNDQNAVFPEISINNTLNNQLQMQRKNTTGQQNPSMTLNSLCKQKNQKKQSLHTIKIIDDGNVSSTFADNKYSISDISNTLKMADQTTSLTELGSLQSKCKNMLQHFISSFEQDQKEPFNRYLVSRCIILEQYLDHPPAQADLKYEAVNSYLELQMMMEAWQFVENKINFLSAKPTFRSLLWYDPSLYGELYKGEVGFQQQSSLFASFQKILAQEGYSKLQEYYSAVSSVHQQLCAATDASYYMYLKSKRELLEAEAALRNPHNIKSFFLSVPMSAMINFGDSLERLEKIHKVIMTFVETPSDQLPGTFDVGKAEHLSITCRYLQEKALFIKSCKEIISKVSWFGIEHLLYDASKVLVWQDMSHGAPSEVLKTYKNSNPQIIFGVTESGVTLVNKVEQPPPSMDGAETPTKQKSDAARKRKGFQLWTSSQSSVAQSVKADKDVAYKRRASLSPLMQCNAVNPLFQSTSATHDENPTPYALPHRVDPGHWGMVGSTAADWNASDLVPPSPSTSHAHSEINSLHQSNRQATLSHSDERRSIADIQRPQQPSVSAPQATLRGDSCVTHLAFDNVKYQQTNTAPHCPVLSQEQVNQFSLAMTQPYSLPNCHLDENLMPPPFSVQALTHVPMPSTITAIHYPYFLLNGQTYTTGSTATIHPNIRYYPNTI
uniref:Testis-expressed sequence 15 protein-like n=2 Tax=Cyprinus carpio TaxID=7962 RepID=A0A8C1Q881_CYPCA